LDSSYKWSQRYAYWRQLYNSGEMPPEVWAEIDEAYDVSQVSQCCIKHAYEYFV
jgi:hypothetical protein